ncbi:PQQ-dependent sugar dehydrogenase [Gaoshiqia sediminis]|uniref:PQQ-dependent sugar dehydrogenase n=1 Tax=Gaoshiqia sediminis TaxID=2986998 RepID=A0AA41Y4S9_9BACT|nr:PQQ-dependent sugar dehydrogenase [Gaoshiqia sediminis]MCW0481914.1 PQQ-dependent sugar dehydrogenase [Gaoshiqia sediminis]
MNSHIRIVSTLLIAIFLILAGCSTGNGRHDDKTMQLAAKNYQNYCAGCHGDKLEKFEKKDWMYGDDLHNIIQSITYGQEEMGMPAFEVTFSAEEIIALASYVKTGLPEDKESLQPALSANNRVESEVQNFIVDTVVSGLEVPWGLEFLPNGDLLIAERSAKLYRFINNQLQEISGLPEIMVKGQGGLMDLELHPNYENTGWLYLSYSGFADDNKREGCTNIMRARLDGNRLVDQEEIFNGTPDSDRGQHWGCKLEFDREGYLFFGIGDRGNRDENPQSLENHAGKIHRIKDDGSIPSDNPFIYTPGAMPSIYSFGHRNPQGTCQHPETGEIWETEHGPMGGDELNLIKPAINYGWPVISYGINYNGTKFTDLTEKEGMEQPITYWVPSIAPCGTTFVKGDRYPNWKNNILIGSLRFQYLERVVLKGYEVTHHEKLMEGIGRVRNVEMSPDGFIYVAIENPGKILKLVPVK